MQTLLHDYITGEQMSVDEKDMGYGQKELGSGKDETDMSPQGFFHGC